MGNGKYTCSRRSSVSLLLLFVLLFLPSLTVSDNKQGGTRETGSGVTVDALAGILDEGDIILRYGNGFWSPFFRNVSRHEKRFSHAGVVVMEKGAFTVVHASAHEMNGEGSVSRVSLEQFLSVSSDYAVYRFETGKNVRLRIAENAKSYVGRPFDSSFNLADSKRLYCTELVMHAVNDAVGYKAISPTVTNGVSLVAPDDCYEGRGFFAVADKRLPGKL